MKRPGLYFTILFVSILCSTILVSAAISGVLKSFHKDDDTRINVKTAPVNANDQLTALKEAAPAF